MPSASFDDAALRLATAASSDGAVITHNLTGSITSWNRAAEQVFGHRAIEMVGQSIRLIVPPELLREQDEMLQRIKAGESLDRYGTVRLRQDGQRLDVSLTVLPLATADGQIVGASQIARVITEHKRLERDAGHLVAIVESSGDATISMDPNGTITTWDRAAERVFGYSVAEAIGQSVRLSIPADRIAEHDGLLHGVRQGEIVSHFYHSYARRERAGIDQAAGRATPSSQSDLYVWVHRRRHCPARGTQAWDRVPEQTLQF